MLFDINVFIVFQLVRTRYFFKKISWVVCQGIFFNVNNVLWLKKRLKNTVLDYRLVWTSVTGAGAMFFFFL